ncbi:MAG: hypothetical protein II617_02755, partial [Firmicutes bacterium]|nr:hypothetical protein [Bacillota bacterium]
IHLNWWITCLHQTIIPSFEQMFHSLFFRFLKWKPKVFWLVLLIEVIVQTLFGCSTQNERHNRLFRRYLPKGKSIDDYSADQILSFADEMNALPRRTLGYCTPEELFDEFLDQVYSVDYRLLNVQCSI